MGAPEVDTTGLASTDGRQLARGCHPYKKVLFSLVRGLGARGTKLARINNNGLSNLAGYLDMHHWSLLVSSTMLAYELLHPLITKVWNVIFYFFYMFKINVGPLKVFVIWPCGT